MEDRHITTDSVSSAIIEACTSEDFKSSGAGDHTSTRLKLPVEQIRTASQHRIRPTRLALILQLMSVYFCSFSLFFPLLSHVRIFTYVLSDMHASKGQLPNFSIVVMAVKCDFTDGIHVSSRPSRYMYM